MLAIGGTMYAAWPAKAGYQSFSSFHGPRLIGPVDELVADPPAAVAPFDQVDPARLVAAVGVVVAGEQVAELVERQLLRVAETRGEDLQLGAVGVAAEHRAGVGHRQLAAVDGRHVEAAVADAEVEPPVGPEPQAVQVVAQEARRGRHSPVAGSCGDRPGRRRRCRGASRARGCTRTRRRPCAPAARRRCRRPGSLKPSAKTVAESARPSPSRSTIRRTRSCSTSYRANPCPRYFLYMATRSATVRQARSSSSQFMCSRVSVTPAPWRKVSAT